MMQRNEILHWLRESDSVRLERLWQLADQTRQRCVGDEVHLRGLVELSNWCVRQCAYCGLRAGNAALQRYRLSDDEVMACARQAVAFGYGTVVLQAGEDPALTCSRVAALVRWIKTETPLAVTLSLGERTDDELAAWRQSGADRYLLRFETSNRTLYERIHPPKVAVPATAQRDGPPANEPSNADRYDRPNEPSNADRHDRPEDSFSGGRYDRPAHAHVPTHRMTILATLRRLGYEVGSGVMIGIPGQTYDDLADDIEWFARLGLDMIGVGPYLRHPNTPLADAGAWPAAAAGQQVPPNEEMTYKVIALARLVCPRANIPATTALATVNRRDGRELGLSRGANVVMPNLTPAKYRALYEIYPDKACIAESGEACHHCLTQRIETLGRQPGRGRGDSPNYRLGVDGCLL
jgi:biotin synthase